MREWFAGLVGEEYASAALWIFAVFILGVLLYAFYSIARRYRSGTFVMGGKNRRTRLAVMDAAAIDSHRRLVLVRRDDVEHLILIGGPSDIVVEQHIRTTPRQARPVVAPGPDVDDAPVPYPSPLVMQPEKTSLEFAPAPVVAPPPTPQPTPLPVRREQTLRTVPPVSAPHAAPSRPVPAPAPAPARPSAPAQPIPLRAVSPAPPAARPEPTLQAIATSTPTRPPVEFVRPEPEPVSAPSVPTDSPPQERTIPGIALAAVAAPPILAPVVVAPDPAASDDSFDDALLQELEITLDETPRAPVAAPKPMSDEDALQDEMARLLGDLAAPRR